MNTAHAPVKRCCKPICARPPAWSESRYRREAWPCARSQAAPDLADEAKADRATQHTILAHSADAKPNLHVAAIATNQTERS